MYLGQLERRYIDSLWLGRCRGENGACINATQGHGDGTGHVSLPPAKPGDRWRFYRACALLFNAQVAGSVLDLLIKDRRAEKIRAWSWRIETELFNHDTEESLDPGRNCKWCSCTVQEPFHYKSDPKVEFNLERKQCLGLERTSDYMRTVEENSEFTVIFHQESSWRIQSPWKKQLRPTL